MPNAHDRTEPLRCGTGRPKTLIIREGVLEFASLIDGKGSSDPLSIPNDW